MILLAGPVASGKTSTAYAVANELGWQVFEVYPGIGKRGYKDLERYVGMVGENHIMKREAPPVSSFFGKAASSVPKEASGASNKTEGSLEQTDLLQSKVSNPFTLQQPATASSSTSTSTSMNGTNEEQNQVKQSCILIEEVDILYEADSGFWEGLISFISKSRRPVILTCNSDFNSVPKDSLPLQNILYFESASGDVASALLTEIARLEGKDMAPEEIEDIVKMAADSAGQVELRLAINQLQYTASCPSRKKPSTSQATTQEGTDDLRTVQKALDNASFADAELRRRDWLALQVSRTSSPRQCARVLCRD